MGQGTAKVTDFLKNFADIVNVPKASRNGTIRTGFLID
jgi:hypothetical protein